MPVLHALYRSRVGLVCPFVSPGSFNLRVPLAGAGREPWTRSVPVPPSGMSQGPGRVRADGLVLDRADGRVVERWEQWDQAGMMQQLGLA